MNWLDFGHCTNNIEFLTRKCVKNRRKNQICEAGKNMQLGCMQFTGNFLRKTSNKIEAGAGPQWETFLSHGRRFKAGL